MFCSNVLFVLVVSCWLCSVGESGVVTPREPFRSYVTGGHQSSELDCSQFKDDFVVLRHLPFPVVILPVNEVDSKYSSAYLNKEGTTVEEIIISHEKMVPLNVFCLSNLSQLYVRATPFANDLLPDALENLKTLRTLVIVDTPIKKLTEQLTSLTNLNWMQLINCSLTSLPDLTNLRKLQGLQADNNQISSVGALPDLSLLYLKNNRLTEIPVLKNPEHLRTVVISHNPLKNIQPILLYKNIEMLLLQNVTLTSIPREINQLQKLEDLSLSSNQLTDLPIDVLNLPQLEFLNVSTNLLSANKIAFIKQAFEKSRPNVELIV